VARLKLRLRLYMLYMLYTVYVYCMCMFMCMCIRGLMSNDAVDTVDTVDTTAVLPCFRRYIPRCNAAILRSLGRGRDIDRNLRTRYPHTIQYTNLTRRLLPSMTDHL
jgi:hypothetical protein